MPAITEYKATGLPYMLAGTLAFSLGAVCIKFTGARIPALEVVFARSLFMFLYCLILARRAGAHIPGHRKALLLLRGTLGFGAYFCIFYSIIHMPLADATVISLAFPLIVPVWAAIFLKEPMETRTILCVFIGAIGMICVTRPPLIFGGVSAYAPLAVAAAVGAAILSSICVTMVRRLTATEHPLVIVLYPALIATIGAPLIGAANWPLPTWTEAAYLLGVGLCMSVGQHCITMGYSRSTAARASVMFYMEVVFSALLGFLVFKEIPTATTIIGAVIIVGGAALLGLKRRT